MTPPNSLTELADRVERLTGPCRETDLAILQAISGHPWRWADSRTFEPQTVITRDEYGEGAPGNPFYTLEEFTASLDAAMTLVPEGCAWQCGCEIDSTPVARVWGHNIHFDEFGASPTLAFLSAILRARASMEADRG